MESHLIISLRGYPEQHLGEFRLNSSPEHKPAQVFKHIDSNGCYFTTNTGVKLCPLRSEIFLFVLHIQPKNLRNNPGCSST